MTHADIMALEDAASEASRAYSRALAAYRASRSVARWDALNAATARHDAVLADLQAARCQLRRELHSPTIPRPADPQLGLFEGASL